MENNNEDELVKSFRAMQDELESLSASVQVMQVNIGHSVQVMQNNIADSVQVMQVNISQLSRAIEDKLCQLRPGNIQTDSMQMTDESLSSPVALIKRRSDNQKRRSDNQKKLKAPVNALAASTSGAGSSNAQYRLVITNPVGRIAPGKDKKIVYVDENLSIDVAVVDERGNQVTTGNLAKMAVKLVVLSSQKFGHDSDGYWERQKFMDAVQEHLATTNASFLLKEGQFLCKNFTIKNSSKRHRFQLGVMITDQTISETYGRILEGVSNHFYVEVKRGKSKLMDERSKEASQNPELPIASGHHSMDEDSQPEDPMQEDSDKRLAVQDPKFGNDPYKLGQDIWKSLLSILQKFPAPEQGLERGIIIDRLHDYIKSLEGNISVVTKDEELMQHQHEAKNCLQRELYHLLNLLLTKCPWVPTPAARGEQNENDRDQYLNRNLLNTNPDGCPPPDEQIPGTDSSLNPLSGADPTATPAENSHGLSVGDLLNTALFSPENTYFCTQTNGDSIFLEDEYNQGYPCRNQHYSPYAVEDKNQIITDVEAVVDYGHEVVALVGPRPAYVNRLQRRRPKTIDDHALYARRIGYYGASGPFGRECAMMGLDQEADRFIQAFYAELIRTCPTNSGGLFGTSHQQVQDVNEINKLMGRLRNEINKMMSRLRIEILPVAVAMTRKMVAALTMSQQAAPANKHQKIHVVEAGPSANKQQQDASRAWCGSSEHHGESVDLKATCLGLDEKKFVVIDLKATCLGLDEKKFYWGDRPFEPEIIEFSSVLVDAATGDIKSVFHTYVRPIKHKLGSFCMDYNGISQEDVEGEDAVMLSEALEAHRAWLEDNGCGGGSGVVVTTWGDWDCRTLLKQECHRKKLHIPGYLSRWMNLKKPFVETYDIDKAGVPIDKLMVQDAVVIAGLGWKGHTEKGGRSHARNKALLLKLLILAGAKLSITGWIRAGVTE